MPSKPAPSPPTGAVVQYENLDLPPAYVEGVQGMATPQGALQVSFYSEFLKPHDEVACELEATVQPEVSGIALRVEAKDPFGLDGGQLRIVRRIEANLVFTVPALKAVVPWLQQKLNELAPEEPSNGNGKGNGNGKVSPS